MDLQLAQDAARRLIDPVLAVVFPSSCPACGALLAHPGRGPLCEACWQALPRHGSCACRCGLPLLPGRAECGRCRRGRQPIAAGASLGPYEGSLRVLLHQLKYAGRRRAAARLAKLLLEDESVCRLLATSDVLVPVPLHPRRLRERGFNQSALIAEELAHGRGAAVLAGGAGAPARHGPAVRADGRRSDGATCATRSWSGAAPAWSAAW